MTHVDSHARTGQVRALITAEQRAALRQLTRRRPEVTSWRDPHAIPPGPFLLGAADTSGADAYAWELVGREVHMASASRVMRRAGSRDLEACQPSDEPGVLSVWYPDPHDEAGRWRDYPIS